MTDYEVCRSASMDWVKKYKVETNQMYDEILPLIRSHIAILNANGEDAATLRFAQYIKTIKGLVEWNNKLDCQIDKLGDTNGELIVIKKVENNIGSCLIPHYAGEDFTGTQPRCIVYNNVEIKVTSWGEVLYIICVILSYKYPTIFKSQVLDIIDCSDTKLENRSLKYLENQKLYIRTNYETKRISKKIENLLIQFNEPVKRLEIYLK